MTNNFAQKIFAEFCKFDETKRRRLALSIMQIELIKTGQHLFRIVFHSVTTSLVDWTASLSYCVSFCYDLTG